MRVLGPGTAQLLGGLLAGALALPVLGQPALPTGDAQRGREIVADRQRGFCLLCHSGPFPEERFQGNLGPSLAPTVPARVAPRVRAQLAEPSLFNPETIMPRYGLPSLGTRIHPQFAGQVLLQASEIDDVVAFLMTLQP